MKIELEIKNSDTYWFLLWLVAFSAVCVIAAILAVYCCYSTDVYTSRGYTRTTLPGASCVYWVKEVK